MKENGQKKKKKKKKKISKNKRGEQKKKNKKKKKKKKKPLAMTHGVNSKKTRVRLLMFAVVQCPWIVKCLRLTRTHIFSF
jgi:hypothetical protein